MAEGGPSGNSRNGNADRKQCDSASFLCFFCAPLMAFQKLLMESVLRLEQSSLQIVDIQLLAAHASHSNQIHLHSSSDINDLTEYICVYTYLSLSLYDLPGVLPVSAKSH